MKIEINYNLKVFLTKINKKSNFIFYIINFAKKLKPKYK